MTTTEHSLIAAELDTAWPTNALEYHNQRIPFVEPIYSAFLNQALEEVDGPIVEIGAGIGYLGSTVPQRYRQRYVQTEVGEKNCQRAQDKNPDLITIAARAQELPFESASVGAVVARNLFDMVDTPAVITEIERVLRPGGLALHMRDHRPSLVWIHEQLALGKTKRLIPHFDADDSFQRLQVISTNNLTKFLAERTVLGFSPDDLSNPHMQDLMSNSADAGRMLIASRLAAPKAERVTDTFGDIMDKRLASWFKKAGFHTAMETVCLGYEMSRGQARSIGWPDNVNHFVSQSNGYWQRWDDETLPDGQVHVTHSFDGFAATKQP